MFDYPENRLFGYAISGSEFRKFSALSGIFLGNFSALLGRQFNRATGAILFQHISNVINASANKKMVWSNARRVVAMVANDLAFWNRAISQFPRNAMGLDCSSFSATNANPSITEVPGTRRDTKRTCPKPALIGLIDILPEANRKRKIFLGGMMGLHSDLLSDAMPRLLNAARGFHFVLGL